MESLKKNLKKYQYITKTKRGVTTHIVVFVLFFFLVYNVVIFLVYWWFGELWGVGEWRIEYKRYGGYILLYILYYYYIYYYIIIRDYITLLHYYIYRFITTLQHYILKTNFENFIVPSCHL